MYDHFCDILVNTWRVTMHDIWTKWVAILGSSIKNYSICIIYCTVKLNYTVYRGWLIQDFVTFPNVCDLLSLVTSDHVIMMCVCCMFLRYSLLNLLFCLSFFQILFTFCSRFTVITVTQEVWSFTTVLLIY